MDSNIKLFGLIGGVSSGNVQEKKVNPSAQVVRFNINERKSMEKRFEVIMMKMSY